MKSRWLVLLVALSAVLILPSAGKAASSCLVTNAPSGSSITCKPVISSVYDVETVLDLSDPKYDQVSVNCYYSSSFTSVCAGGGE
jgi:hypothetical protein